MIDLLFSIGCETVGMIMGLWLAPSQPASLRLLAGTAIGLVLYLLLVYPFYRRLKLFPMILPRCPCCAQPQLGFHFVNGWPRVAYRCPTWNGDFVIWLDGKVGASEEWERPVLILKWPYAWGIYKRVREPEQVAAPNGPRERSAEEGRLCSK